MESGPAYLLRQGIAAAKMGQKETARNLLTRVVEQDERNADWPGCGFRAWSKAWMINEVCLENVLALDPENQAARKGLEWVRETKGSGAAGVRAAVDFRPARVERVATHSGAGHLAAPSAGTRATRRRAESVSRFRESGRLGGGRTAAVAG